MDPARATSTCYEERIPASKKFLHLLKTDIKTSSGAWSKKNLDYFLDTKKKPGFPNVGSCEIGFETEVSGAPRLDGFEAGGDGSGSARVQRDGKAGTRIFQSVITMDQVSNYTVFFLQKFLQHC